MWGMVAPVRRHASGFTRKAASRARTTFTGTRQWLANLGRIATSLRRLDLQSRAKRCPSATDGDPEIRQISRSLSFDPPKRASGLSLA